MSGSRLQLQEEKEIKHSSDKVVRSSSSVSGVPIGIPFSLSVFYLQEAQIVHAAKTILFETKEDDTALKLVTKYPHALTSYQVKVSYYNDAVVEGNLLQITAMAGDFNLCQKLASAVNLPDEEVAKNISSVFQKDFAKEAEKRMQHYSNAVEKFSEALFKTKLPSLWGKNEYTSFTTIDFLNTQKKCELIIEQFRKNMQPKGKDVVSYGFIFDVNIFIKTIKWFIQHEKKFYQGSHDFSSKADIFWVTVIGTLQSLSPAPLKKIFDCGLVNFLEEKPLQESREQREKLSERYYCEEGLIDYAKLGVHYYLGYYGAPRVTECMSLRYPGSTRWEGHSMLTKLTKYQAILNKHIENLSLHLKEESTKHTFSA